MANRQVAVRSQGRRGGASDDQGQGPAVVAGEHHGQVEVAVPQPAGAAGRGVVADEGTQGTQAIPATQLPDLNTLPTLEEAHSTYIPTHKWPPKSVRPELSRTLTSLWQRLASHPEDENLWIMASIFFRCILPAGQDLNLDENFSKMQQIKERLRRWQTGECGALWEEAKATQVVKARR